MPSFPPIDVHGDPPRIRARLSAGMVCVGSVWFPTRRELRVWSESTAPLYLRWLGTDRLEVGPRQPTMAASRMSPVLRGRLESTGGGRTRIAWRVTLPTTTAVVLGGWTITLVTWAVWIVPRFQMEEGSPWGWVIAWTTLALATALGSAAAWITGRRSLQQAVPWLREVADRPEVLDEDW